MMVISFRLASISICARPCRRLWLAAGNPFKSSHIAEFAARLRK